MKHVPLDLNVEPDASRSLAGYVLFSLLGAGVTAVLLFADPRTLSGEPLWLKPFKFFLSSAVFAATLEWCLRFASERIRRLNLLRRIVAWGLVYEMVVICVQALRGVKSHFNYSTPLDSVLFSTMGLVISVVVTAGVAAAWFSATGANRMSAAERVSIRSGFILFGIAAFLGVSMTRPTPEQFERLRAGERAEFIGSHFVGSQEGSTRTLPLTGWSLESGDLRVAHFYGMHMIQILILLTLGMKRARIDLDTTSAADRVRSVSLALGAGMMILFTEAWLGRSAFDPGPEFWLIRAIWFSIVAFTMIRALKQKPLHSNALSAGGLQ